MNKKILIVIAFMSIIVLSGCQSKDYNWSSSCKPQEKFCESKGMRYECGDWKHHIMFCTDCKGNKIHFTYDDFKKFECEPKPELSCNYR